jgi:hypothetical protein
MHARRLVFLHRPAHAARHRLVMQFRVQLENPVVGVAQVFLVGKPRRANGGWIIQGNTNFPPNASLEIN